MSRNKLRAMRIIVIMTTLTLVLIFVSITIWNINLPYHNASKLIDAIEMNDVALVQEMLAAGVDPNQTNIKPSKAWAIVESSAIRPLTIACAEGNLEIVELLIQYGATAEYIEYTGWSPLRMALFHYHENDLDIVKLLLANGADPHVTEGDYTAVFAAADMVPAATHNENNSVEYNADVAEQITQIVILLLSDDSVNIQTTYGKTLLMYAANRGNLNLAKYLVDCGCDVNITDNSGKTAIDYAHDANQQNMVLLLKDLTTGNTVADSHLP